MFTEELRQLSGLSNGLKPDRSEIFLTVKEVVVLCSILLTMFSAHLGGTFPWPLDRTSCVRPF